MGKILGSVDGSKREASRALIRGQREAYASKVEKKLLNGVVPYGYSGARRMKKITRKRKAVHAARAIEASSRLDEMAALRPLKPPGRV